MDHAYAHRTSGFVCTAVQTMHERIAYVMGARQLARETARPRLFHGKNEYAKNV